MRQFVKPNQLRHTNTNESLSRNMHELGEEHSIESDTQWKFLAMVTFVVAFLTEPNRCQR